METLQKPETKNCKCGNVFVPKGAGIHKVKCPECVAEALSKPRAPREAKPDKTDVRTAVGDIAKDDKADAAALESIQERVTVNGNVLVIDFSQKSEVLAEVKRIADEQERTPEGQVIFWLKSMVRRNITLADVDISLLEEKMEAGEIVFLGGDGSKMYEKGAKTA